MLMKTNNNSIILNKAEAIGKSKLGEQKSSHLFLSVPENRGCWQPFFCCSSHFSPKLLLRRNQSVDYLYESMDWFLHNSNTVLKWVNMFLILSVL